MKIDDARKRADVVDVRREDLIVIATQRNEGGVDSVATARGTKQESGAASESVVKSDDVSGRQEPRQPGLPTRTTAPDLSHDPAVGNRCAAEPPLALDDDQHVIVTALGRDEGPRVEDDSHAVLRPRTGVAFARSRFVVAAISSSVMTPCSASYSAISSSIARIRRSCAT